MVKIDPNQVFVAAYSLDKVFFGNPETGEQKPLLSYPDITFAPPTEDDIQVFDMSKQIVVGSVTMPICNDFWTTDPPNQFFHMILLLKPILGRWITQSRTRHPRLPLRSIKPVGWRGDVLIKLNDEQSGGH